MTGKETSFMPSDVLAWPLRALVAVYRYGFSPFTAGSCRFHPTCSAYADEALGTHGAWRGGLLALSRLCRCHPWGGSGYDPVPSADTATDADTMGRRARP